MQKAYQKPPVLAIEDLGLNMKTLAGDPIEELARYGARLVLTSYLEAEVATLLQAGPYQRSPLRRGSRNGHRSRRVSCGVGSIEIDYPKVRDSKQPFHSEILGAWQRKSQTLFSTLPSLYLEGLSTRDFDRALSPLWKDTALSPTTISRANEQIKQAFQAWRQRSLKNEQVVYLFLDGHYQGVRLGVKEKEAVLVAHGITKAGKRTLLGVYLGSRESTDSWKLVLQDLIGRGLVNPLLVISDGNPGLIRAVKETWPAVLRQRCTVHRIRNVLARIPKKDHARLRRTLNRIFYATCLDEALEASEVFARQWRNVYPSAVEILTKDLADCLTFFRFPPRHWKRLRTSNSLERSFKEVRRRTRVIGRFPTEMSALSLIWSVMDQDSQRWYGLIMDGEHLSLAQAAAESLAQRPIVLKGLERILAA
jgi:transposase-like protein